MSLSTNFPTTRPSLLLDFVNSGQMDPRITFSRASGATWFNSAGTLIGVDSSTTSLTVGTGWQTLTLAATAGVDRGWTVGTSVQLSASTATNTMTGVVVSYTASTQTLVVSVASIVGSGTYATWQVSNLMPRLDYNPSTLAAQGLLIEEARTNSIRNNTMQGAVAGTPGTLPTNWASQINTTTGLSSSVIGTGTENGITYLDVRLNGTASGAGSFDLFFEPANSLASLTGQTWTGSLYWKLQAGSTTGLSAAQFRTYEYTSGVTFIVSQSVNLSFPTSAALNTQRAPATFTLSGGPTTAFQRPLIAFNIANGAAIDITLRIGLPQLEQGAFATSVIPTTTTALTRSADVASVNTLSPWYNVSAGTMYAEIGSAPVNTIPQFAYALNDNLGGGLGQVFTRRTGGSTVNTAVSDGGVTQADIGSLTTVAGSATYKVASAFAANDFAISLNGGAVVTDTSGALPSTIAKLFLGQNYVGGQVLNGYLRRITYYPRRLSNAELQAITA